MGETRYRIAACDYQEGGARLERVLINMGGTWVAESRAAIVALVEREPERCWTWIATEGYEYEFGAPVTTSGIFLAAGTTDPKKDDLGSLPPLLHCPFKAGPWRSG